MQYSFYPDHLCATPGLLATPPDKSLFTLGTACWMALGRVVFFIISQNVSSGNPHHPVLALHSKTKRIRLLILPPNSSSYIRRGLQLPHTPTLLHSKHPISSILLTTQFHIYLNLLKKRLQTPKTSSPNMSACTLPHKHNTIVTSKKYNLNSIISPNICPKSNLPNWPSRFLHSCCALSFTLKRNCSVWITMFFTEIDATEGNKSLQVFYFKEFMPRMCYKIMICLLTTGLLIMTLIMILKIIIRPTTIFVKSLNMW